MRRRSQEIEIRLPSDAWLLLKDALEGDRSAALKSRIEHSVRSLRRAPDGTLSLIFSPQDGDIVAQTVRRLFSGDADRILSARRGLATVDPLPPPAPVTRPDPGSWCQAYRLSAGLPADATNRCEQRAAQRLQVRHRGTSIPLNLCTQHARQNTHRRRPLYFVVGTDLIGIGHPE